MGKENRLGIVGPSHEEIKELNQLSGSEPYSERWKKLSRGAAVVLGLASPAVLASCMPAPHVEVKPAEAATFDHFVYLPLVTNKAEQGPTSTDPLKNLSFEEVDANGLPVGWVKASNPDLTRYSQTTAHSGSASVEVELQIRNLNGAIGFFPGKWRTAERIPVEAGNAYVMGYWAKKVVEGSLAIGPAMNLVCYDALGQKIGTISLSYTNKQTDTEGWVQSETVVGPGEAKNWPAGTASVDIEATAVRTGMMPSTPAGTLGKVWVDDITFRQK